MKRFIVIIFFAFSIHANSQVCFSPPMCGYKTGNGPTSICTADFNNDSFPDLACGNFSYKFLSVFLNDGSHGFNASFSLCGLGAFCIVSSDFNSDGNADLAILRRNYHVLTIMLGDGLGGFGDTTNYSVHYPFDLTVADFNGDSIPDIAVTGYYPDAITLFTGDGSGAFGSAQNLLMSECAYYITAMDINGDSRPDLIANNFCSSLFRVSIFINNGNGNFSLEKNMYIDGWITSLRCDDFNHDGLPELVIAGNNSDYFLRIYPGDGNGNFLKPQILPCSVPPHGRIANADFNGDGKTDLAIVTEIMKGTVNIFLGNDAGGFDSALVICPEGTRFIDICAGDFNNDNKPDIAAPDYMNDVMRVLYNCSQFPGIKSVSGKKISVFPLPASAVVNIKGITCETNLTLSDMSGRICINQVVHSDAMLNLSELDEGMYVLTAQMGKEFFSVKVPVVYDP